MAEAFAADGARLDAIYYCPHYDLAATRATGPTAPAASRARAWAGGPRRELGLDLGRSYMIGDKVEDVQFGLAIGATPVLVRTGYGRDTRKPARRAAASGRPPSPTTSREAVDWILARERAVRP